MRKTKAVAIIEAAIDKAGSKAALARDLECSTSHLNSWLDGGIPRYPTMVELRRQLKIPLDAWVQEATDAA